MRAKYGTGFKNNPINTRSYNRKHRFDLPYNFNKKYVDFLCKYTCNDPDIIYSIYIPPYAGHYISSRPYLFNKKDTPETYADHVEYINKKLPGKAMLLVQNRDTFIDTDILKNFYIDKLHFKKFCVGNFEQAKIIRELCPDAEIVGSIIMKLKDPKEFERPEFKGVFDGFVLWFTYNRDITCVSNLPKDYYYILLVNSACTWHCDGDHHWFRKNDEWADFKCPVESFPGFENNTYIRPIDLELWDPYIKVYKLQGRDYSNEKLIEDFITFCGSYDPTRIKNNRDDYDLGVVNNERI